MSKILVIDSGNSFVKWGFFDSNSWSKQGNIAYENVFDLERAFSNLPEPNIILVSHVAREKTKNVICDLIAQWSTQPHWIHSSLFQCGVLNGYSNPGQLGSDRWAALIAAWKIEQKACLVINAGTAVTIDALSDSGEFLGGVILPGTHLMLNSLHSNTQLEYDKAGSYQDFPVNTNNAIHSGIVQCLIGAIERMHDLLSLRLNHITVSCIISGGGASLLIPFIKLPVRIIDNLVLEGLIVIAEDALRSQKLAIS